jgi:glycosyltransferase involved in cell wall biosynthesis
MSGSNFSRGPLLRAAHVIAGLEAGYGGPSYSVPRLCAALTAAGVDTTLLSIGECSGSRHHADGGAYKSCSFEIDHPSLPVLRDLRVSSGLSRALRAAAPSVDAVHNHGLWLMPNVQAGWATKRAKTPLIVAPRGMLASAALAFSSRKKRLFWALFQGSAIRHAACFHATSYQEYQEIRGFGVTCAVAVIPNGIDLPTTSGPIETPTNRTALTLGRIHPKKGLDRLLHAWARVEDHHPGWKLRIIGPAEHGHDVELRALATHLEIVNVSIEPPIYNDEKYVAFRGADFFVLPSLNENFGLTVAESLAAGTPVISTKGAPWSGLESERCGWWIDHGVEPLAAALQRAMSLPSEELSVMGARGRAWMARDYGWNAIAMRTMELYSWVSRGAERPNFVYVD